MREECEIYALTLEYRGILRGELGAARRVASAAKVKEHRMAKLPDLREAAEIRQADFPGLPPTYIPMRNAIFYSYASSYAEELKAEALVGGHNLDDAGVFRDVSEEFFERLQAALRAGSATLDSLGLTIRRPLKDRSKVEVVKLAQSLGVPLGLTWSCHRDGSEHCWNCEGCKVRRDSFRGAGVADPLGPF